MSRKCGCDTFYFFGGDPECLHQLFASGLVRIVCKEYVKDKVTFYIYRDAPKLTSAAWKRGWWKNGVRSKLHSREQILLAVELLKKYPHVRAVKL